MALGNTDTDEQVTKDHEDMWNRFTFHKATPDTALMHDAVREECRQVAGWIIQNFPNSRNRSLALTALEEVMFRLNAAVATGR